MRGSRDDASKGEIPNRRKQERFPMEPGVPFQILMPEETFQPRSLKAKILNISVAGMQLLVPGLPQDLYSKLILGTRHGRVTLTDSTSGEQLKVTGRIHWYDYQIPDKAQLFGDCLIGMHMNESATGNLNDYMAFVERITPGRG